jgi:two-component system response regulator MprA
MAKILVVDDDKDLAGMVEDALTFDHHAVELVFTGSEARDMLRVYKYDAIVLDWDLPGMSGIDVCKELRNKGDLTPILMLTGKGEMDNKEQGLDAGADDYLTKPFQVRELKARMRALLRRASGSASNILTIRDIELDATSFRVTKAGKEIKLVQREFQLLEFFMRNPNKVFSAEAILDRVWASDSDASPEAFRTCLTRLRKKIDTDGADSLISTVHGVGYKFNA